MIAAGTSYVQSFALGLDAPHRSALPRRGTESRMLPHSNEASMPFRWWMRKASDVSLRAVSEADSPGVSKDAFKAIAEV